MKKVGGGEIGEFGTLVDILFWIGEREMEEETRYQENIGRKEGRKGI